MMRRSFLRTAALASAAWLHLPRPGFSLSPAPVAATSAGRIRGSLEDGLFRFKNIPYGADTARFRFQPPRPPAPWSGVRETIHWGNRAPQTGGRNRQPSAPPSGYWLPPRPRSAQ
jgi:para-nitrobenzyl esterase